MESLYRIFEGDMNLLSVLTWYIMYYLMLMCHCFDTFIYIVCIYKYLYLPHFYVFLSMLNLLRLIKTVWISFAHHSLPLFCFFAHFLHNFFSYWCPSQLSYLSYSFQSRSGHICVTSLPNRGNQQWFSKQAINQWCTEVCNTCQSKPIKFKGSPSNSTWVSLTLWRGRQTCQGSEDSGQCNK